MPEISLDALRTAYDAAQAILKIAPGHAAIWAVRPDHSWMDGKEVWNTLHRMGFRWGDMDCFQWADPTDQTDYLIWVEVRDGQYDYALPEEIAAGRQNFSAVRFSVELTRTPAAPHVVREMIRAAEAFASELGANLAAELDDQPCDTPDALTTAAESVAACLARLGTKPGASSVCGLR